MALSGNCIEANSGHIRLQDVEASVFRIFAQWLLLDNTSRTPYPNAKRSCKEREGELRNTTVGSASDVVVVYDADTKLSRPCTHWDTELLVKLYGLGERFLSSHFKNAIVKQLIDRVEMHHLLPGPKIVKLVHELTSKQSPLRKLCVDMHVWTGLTSTFDPKWKWEANHTQAVAHGFVRLRFVKHEHRIDRCEAPYFVDVCDSYHEHAAGERTCPGKASTRFSHGWTWAITS